MKKETFKDDNQAFARLTVYGLSSMSRLDFERTIEWLRDTAKMLKKEGKDRKVFSRRFIARLY